MTRRLILTLLLTAVLPAVGLATPREREYRLHPKDVAASPSYVQRVEPAIVARPLRSQRCLQRPAGQPPLRDRHHLRHARLCGDRHL